MIQKNVCWKIAFTGGRDSEKIFDTKTEVKWEGGNCMAKRE